MKRIGITASKISKGNLTLYNIYVIVIAMLFSLFIFLVAGSTVLLALRIIEYVGDEVIGSAVGRDWNAVLIVCMVALTVIVTLFTVAAVLINLKMPKRGSDFKPRSVPGLH